MRCCVFTSTVAPALIGQGLGHGKGPGVRFSKLPRTFRARKHFGALFGCFSRVPKSVSQNTRKCPELSPDIFRESFRVTGYSPASIMRLELAERLF